MSQNRPFPRIPPQPPSQPEQPPSGLAFVRRRLSRFYHSFRWAFLIGAGILISLTAVFIYDATQPPAQYLTQNDFDAAVGRALESMPPEPYYASQVYGAIRPSVVRVQALIPESGEGKESEGAVGTGVVIDDIGIILTSLHVIRDAEKVSVVFADGSESEAVVIAEQPENDLAVLRAFIVPDDLVPATLASSATLQVGDEVVAVGHPFGIGESLTAGVVSGLGRNFISPSTGELLTNLIQFDAAVNPGSSGGPLVNREGEVVGIVTALLNPNDQDAFIGIGFAVTIETAAAAAGPPWW